MRVLLVGSGGREHALAWKIAQSPMLTKLYAGPGNPGIAQHAELVSDLRPTDPGSVLEAAQRLRIDLVVVGPEAPLVAGVADALEKATLPVFGPTRAAARIEGSKAFCKEILEAARVPTAAARVFDELGAAEAYARTQKLGVVVKADGLAAGKGVVVATCAEEAIEAVRSLGKLEAGSRLLLEEVLEGPEVSVIALSDGEHFALFPPAQDHKRLGDGDTGPNTGGMGAYCPCRVLTPAMMAEVGRTVIAPVLAELRRRHTPFRGALFAGLMVTREGPKVLEFNCRFGDPETQVLMMQLGEDLHPLLHACASGNLAERPLAVLPGASVGVVLAAAGYPEAPRSGDPIEGLGGEKDAVVFHAGTRVDAQGQTVTAGGRVLTVCARGQDLAQAREKAYPAAARSGLRGQQKRSDSGVKGL
jgi:phosphoribosylamine--glycine ligase